MVATVFLDISVSVDGLVARGNDEAGPIHDWFFTGGQPHPENGFFRTAGASSEVLSELFERIGAVVAGRCTYDLTGGWGGSHPIGAAPVIVVT